MGTRIVRIIVEPSDKETREKLNLLDQADKDEVERMVDLKSRVVVSNSNKSNNSCRKRKVNPGTMSGRTDEPSPIPKRCKGGAPMKDDAKPTSTATKVKNVKRGSVAAWLQSCVLKASTPVRGTNNVSSVPGEVSVERVGPEVASTSKDAQSNVSSESKNSSDGFDSTESWFMLNVNSFCDVQGENMDATDAKGGSATGLDSDSSSFLRIIDDYSTK